LFLRNYLLQSCRNVLPDVTVEEINNATGGKEDHSGTVEDSVEFILLNFAEMNKLWVRMQHQGHSRDRERREKERLELRLLVGTNMVRLSQLESIDLERYQKMVLPGILEQVVSCKDGIAQEYLMECLIQVFPDEYHLSTLNAFLNSCARLVSTVNVKNIIIALIDRLAASKDIELPDDLFETFSKQILNIKLSRPEMPLNDIVLMEGSLINFSLKKIDDQEKREESINSVLATTLEVIKEKQDQENESSNKLADVGKRCGNKISSRSAIGKELLKFLRLPITSALSANNTANGMFAIKLSLKLSNYKELLKEVCDHELHKQITMSLLNSALDVEGEEKVLPELRLSLEEIEIFLSEICQPLITSTIPVEQELLDEKDEDFVDEQTILSRFIHYLLSPVCIDPDDLETHYLVLNSAKKILQAGGKRIRFTFPSLVCEALALTSRYARVGPATNDEKWEKKCAKIFKFIHQCIKAMMDECDCAYLALRLLLQAALNANKTRVANHETVAYDFISQVFPIYEEEISESKLQIACLLQIIGTLKEIKFEQDEHLDPLRIQCGRYAGQLVKKSDQVRALLHSTVLFVENNRFDNSGIKCIKKCIKTASSSLDQELQVQLYVEIFSHLTMFLGCENSTELHDLLTGLIGKINELKNEVSLTQLVEKQYANNLQVWQQHQRNLSVD
jgi:vacuolar protein sorting-associated protein 35